MLCVRVPNPRWRAWNGVLGEGLPNDWVGSIAWVAGGVNSNRLAAVSLE